MNKEQKFRALTRAETIVILATFFTILFIILLK